jgi:BirA family biotin operon repressor/biotin-[acetyl-CoA-carboxylase] ligase
LIVSGIYVNHIIIMVNQKRQSLSTKAYILETLRKNEGDFLSGEVLGAELGISRVAVRKAVKSLEASGYPLEGGDRGYRFTGAGEGDFLYPWEFGEREAWFRHWVSTDSTMNRAEELARRGSPGGTIITAEVQTQGRGRNGRSWVSKRGGLFFTLLERPRKAVMEYPLITMAVHAAVRQALSSICGKEARLRWPNDVFIKNKKIAGILTELHGEGDRIVWLSIGIGVNVNNSPSGGAVNCAELLGHPLSRRIVLLKILREFEETKESAPRELKQRWNYGAEGIGGEAFVIENGPVQSQARVLGRGTFLGIDARGRGLVKDPRGGIRAFSPGSVSLRF